MKTKILSLISSVVVSSQLFADEPADKSQYTIWNPTPRELMREMSTDRPDKTESAYTVDAGHFQIETDVLGYSEDRHSGSNERVKGWSFFNANLKVGLCNNSD